MFGLTPRAEKRRTQPPHGGLEKSKTLLAEGPTRDEVRLARALEEILKSTPEKHRRPGNRYTPEPDLTAFAELRAQHTPQPTIAVDTKGSSILPAGAPDKTRSNNDDNDEAAEDFEWVMDEGEDPQSASKRSHGWLRRARRDNRRTKLRHSVQWLLLLSGAATACVLTLWPRVL